MVIKVLSTNIESINIQLQIKHNLMNIIMVMNHLSQDMNYTK